MRTSSKASPRDEFRMDTQSASLDGSSQGGATPPDGWTSLIGTRANVLVTGTADALTAFVSAARPAMREPVRWTSHSALMHPEPARPAVLPARTLILTDVNGLDEAGQQWLMTWLNERNDADTQVISLTSVPLFALVESKRFDATLYYRLNTIHLKI
jgi:hypothetical protein